MADEYIRKQDAIDVAREDGKKTPTVATRIMHDINAIPAIDVIRPVRCCECKHWHKAMTEDGVEMINFSHCKKGHRGDGLTWFCADGDRKEETDG